MLVPSGKPARAVCCQSVRGPSKQSAQDGGIPGRRQVLPCTGPRCLRLSRSAPPCSPGYRRPLVTCGWLPCPCGRNQLTECGVSLTHPAQPRKPD
ncbi:hypothetical protein H8959_022336 [Pygathrix nigripes]